MLEDVLEPVIIAIAAEPRFRVGQLRQPARS